PRPHHTTTSNTHENRAVAHGFTHSPVGCIPPCRAASLASRDDMIGVPRTIEVLDGGTFTTVQDYPGRIGYRSVGVPTSGPMDALSSRLANRVLNNLESAAGLEMTTTGATLRFDAETTICLTGAPMRARLDGERVPFLQPLPVRAGQTLVFGGIEGPGCR